MKSPVDDRNEPEPQSRVLEALAEEIRARMATPRAEYIDQEQAFRSAHATWKPSDGAGAVTERWISMAQERAGSNPSTKSTSAPTWA